MHRSLKERYALMRCAFVHDWRDSSAERLDDAEALLEWDDFLPIIQHSYNSVPNAATRVSANKVLFGKDLRLPLDRIEPTDDAPIPPEEWIQRMDARRVLIHNDASEALQRARDRRKRKHSKRRKPRLHIEVGDWVLYDTHENKASKPQYEGPFEIIHLRDEAVRLRQVGRETNLINTNRKCVKLYNRSTYVCILTHLGRTNNDNKILKHIQWWTELDGHNIHRIRLPKGENQLTHEAKQALAQW